MNADTSTVVVVEYGPTRVVEVSAPGPQGPPGKSAASSATVWRFDQPTGQWSMPHGYGRPATVALYDSAGRLFLADVTSDQAVATATFSTPTAGVAVTS